MSQDPNLSRSPDYYAARAIEERRLAMASEDENVRAIHLEMADKYDQLAAGGDAEPQQLIGGEQKTG